MSKRGRAGQTLAAGVSLAPGFVFPFVLAIQLSTESSDLFLLASSLIVTLASVVGSAIEVNTVVQMGRVLSRQREISHAERRRYRKRQLFFAVWVSVGLGAVLTLVYGVRVYANDPGLFILVACVCMLVPIFGSSASVRSGELIARGNSIAPVLLQSFRTVPPLCIVLLFPGVHPVGVATALCFGEVCRVLLLEMILRRMPTVSETFEHERLVHAGTGIQALSSASTQAGPVTDRFLLGPITGSITAYEIADKIFYACFQFVNMSMVVTKLRVWSGIRSMDPYKARILIRRDMRNLSLTCAVVVGSGVGVLWGASTAGIVPDSWAEGVKWACIGLSAFPFAIGTFVCSRFLVIAGGQALMMWLSIIVTVSNIAVNWLLISMMGPIGVPLGTALVRVAAFVIYLFVCLKVVPRVFATDLGIGEKANLPGSTSAPLVL